MANKDDKLQRQTVQFRHLKPIETRAKDS
jgi:hypothetical protein